MWKVRGLAADRLISGILNLIYPSSCPSCSSPSDHILSSPFCIKCWSGLQRYTGASCRICAVPFASQFSGTCSECLESPPSFSEVSYFGIYEGILAQAIHSLKFQGIRRLHRPLGMLLSGICPGEIDAVIAVPMTVKGLRARGFNQSLLLAKVVSNKIEVPLIIDGLVKIAETAPQLGLSKKQRLLNLKGAFTASLKVKGLRLLLIDDVMTTGATARECSKALIGAGASDVKVLTLARAKTS